MTKSPAPGRGGIPPPFDLCTLPKQNKKEENENKGDSSMDVSLSHFLQQMAGSPVLLITVVLTLGSVLW